MDWIMECNETVESAWSEAESAAKAKGEDLERNYTHCEYDDVQTNFIYSQVRPRREVGIGLFVVVVVVVVVVAVVVVVVLAVVAAAAADTCCCCCCCC